MRAHLLVMAFDVAVSSYRVTCTLHIYAYETLINSYLQTMPITSFYAIHAYVEREQVWQKKKQNVITIFCIIRQVTILRIYWKYIGIRLDYQQYSICVYLFQIIIESIQTCSRCYAYVFRSFIISAQIKSNQIYRFWLKEAAWIYEFDEHS